MIKRWLLALAATVMAGALWAETLVGRVVSEDGPVSYASVYMQDNPLYGTITDSLGVFVLDNFETRKVMVVSFIGYKTMEVKLRKMPKDTLEITMEEQPILLAETQVERKPRKKSKRREKIDFLDAVWEQMDKDFADENRSYSIVSDYCIYQDDAIAAFEELSGQLIELPEGTDERKVKNKNFSQLKPNWVKRYRNPFTQAKFDRLDNQLEKEENVNRMHWADSSAVIHRVLWGTSPKLMFDEINSKIGRWEISEQDSSMLLTYHEDRNFLGIVKMDLYVNYILNPYSYRIQKISQSLEVWANIPFGYKLNEDQLTILNVIMLTEDDLEKFRVKRVDADIKRNIIFCEDDQDRVSVKEKNVISKIRIADKKDNSMYFHQTASIKAHLESTSAVRPFTPEELHEDFPIYEVYK